MNEPLKPKSVQSVDVSSIVDLPMPDGHVMLVALYPDGTEKQGSEFFYPANKYKQFYGDVTKFAVKKS